MAITRKNRVTPQHLEEVVSTYGYTLASVARETGIDRITLSKFRNHGQALKLEDSRALIGWMRENELWEDDDRAVEGFPQGKASAEVLAFPRPAFALNIADDLPTADREAALSELDAIVRENDRLLAIEMKYASFSLNAYELSGGAKAINEELRQGLTYEALLRRVLAGSFKARHVEGQAATHADLIAQQLLQRLPAGEPIDPDPLAESSPGISVAEAAAAGTAGGEGPSVATND